jgi:hypothetical protein
MWIDFRKVGAPQCQTLVFALRQRSRVLGGPGPGYQKTAEGEESRFSKPVRH